MRNRKALQVHCLDEAQYSALFKNQFSANFIHHPPSFPLSYRRIRPKQQSGPTDRLNIGLCFRASEHITLGNSIEITIPIQRTQQKFHGRVVLVKNMINYFLIGLWLSQNAYKARAVEQICHIETYLKSKRYEDGPFVDNKRIIEEWISKYAAMFPLINFGVHHRGNHQ